MKNMRRQTGLSKLIHTLAAALLASMACATAAAGCPRKDALNTARVLAVDATATPRVGLKSFPQTLPLGDHEVVLTFDDGPWPPTTRRVLAALARECVRATFFLIGKSASEHPDLVRRIAAEGHSIGHHTWSHPSLARIPAEQAVESIAVEVERIGEGQRYVTSLLAGRDQPALEAPVAAPLPASTPD